LETMPVEGQFTGTNDPSCPQRKDMVRCLRIIRWEKSCIIFLKISCFSFSSRYNCLFRLA
jgi:hypothetical protein